MGTWARQPRVTRPRRRAVHLSCRASVATYSPWPPARRRRENESQPVAAGSFGVRIQRMTGVENLALRMGSSPAGARDRRGSRLDGTGTTATGPAGRDGGVPAEPCWRPWDHRCTRSSGEGPQPPNRSFEPVDHASGGAARAQAAARPPHPWGSSPDACGGLFCQTWVRRRSPSSAA